MSKPPCHHLIGERPSKFTLSQISYPITTYEVVTGNTLVVIDIRLTQNFKIKCILQDALLHNMLKTSPWQTLTNQHLSNVHSCTPVLHYLSVNVLPC